MPSYKDTALGMIEVELQSSMNSGIMEALHNVVLFKSDD